MNTGSGERFSCAKGRILPGMPSNGGPVVQKKRARPTGHAPWMLFFAGD